MKKIIFECTNCHKSFNKTDAQKICSNCFACTGCEIFLCPYCEKEVVIKAVKPMKRQQK